MSTRDRSRWIDRATDENGPRIADASAIVGGFVWAVVSVLGLLAPVQDVVALAVLVIVPLGVRLADTPRRDGSRSIWYRVAVLGQPVAAVATVGALWLPRGPPAVALAVPWLLLTASVAAFGVWRFLQRGPRPLAELAVDAGLVYLPVASVALVLDRLGVFLFFEPVIITLTVVHFHYAGFALPLVAGLAGRVTVGDPWRRLLRGTTAFVVAGPAVIAVGISFSPLVEVVAVAAFTVAVSLFAIALLGGVLAALATWPQRLLVGVGAIALPVSMAAAFLYGLGEFTGTTYVTIGQMVATHGQLNAFGFALCSLVGWRLVRPASNARAPGIRFSRLGGTTTVGTDFFEREGLVGDRPAFGMVESVSGYAHDGFDPGGVDDDVRRFFERSGDYALAVDPTWSRIGRFLAALYRPIALRTQQLILPRARASGDAVLTGEAVAVDLPEGRSDARAWIRSNEDRVDDSRRLTYVAAYTRYGGSDVDDEPTPLLEVVFPLMIGSLTGLLRFEHADDGRGLVLSSYPDATAPDDAGLYLVVRGFGIRLPLDETITVTAGESNEPLAANHDVTLLGRRLVTLRYEITLPAGGTAGGTEEGSADR